MNRGSTSLDSTSHRTRNELFAKPRGAGCEHRHMGSRADQAGPPSGRGGQGAGAIPGYEREAVTGADGRRVVGLDPSASTSSDPAAGLPHAQRERVELGETRTCASPSLSAG